MKSCLFCNTELCTCTAKILERYEYLSALVIDYQIFIATHFFSDGEKKTILMMYDQAKEELRKIKLLITFKPYQNEKPKRKNKAH